MAHKKKPEPSASRIGKTILNLVVLLPTLYSLVGKVFMLAKYEARLARKSLVKIIVIAILVGIIVASTWLCLLALYSLYLLSCGWSYQWTLIIVIFINILVLAILGVIIMGIEKNLSFYATRNQIRQLLKSTRGE